MRHRFSCSTSGRTVAQNAAPPIAHRQRDSATMMAIRHVLTAATRRRSLFAYVAMPPPPHPAARANVQAAVPLPAFIVGLARRNLFSSHTLEQAATTVLEPNAPRKHTVAAATA